MNKEYLDKISRHLKDAQAKKIVEKIAEDKNMYNILCNNDFSDVAKKASKNKKILDTSKSKYEEYLEEKRLIDEKNRLEQEKLDKEQQAAREKAEAEKRAEYDKNFEAIAKQAKLFRNILFVLIVVMFGLCYIDSSYVMGILLVVLTVASIVLILTAKKTYDKVGLKKISLARNINIGLLVLGIALTGFEGYSAITSTFHPTIGNDTVVVVKSLCNKLEFNSTDHLKNVRFDIQKRKKPIDIYLSTEDRYFFTIDADNGLFNYLGDNDVDINLYIDGNIMLTGDIANNVNKIKVALSNEGSNNSVIYFENAKFDFNTLETDIQVSLDNVELNMGYKDDVNLSFISNVVKAVNIKGEGYTVLFDDLKYLNIDEQRSFKPDIVNYINSDVTSLYANEVYLINSNFNDVVSKNVDEMVVDVNYLHLDETSSFSATQSEGEPDLIINIDKLELDNGAKFSYSTYQKVDLKKLTNLIGVPGINVNEASAGTYTINGKTISASEYKIEK